MITILYGCGKFYDNNKKVILKHFKVDFVCDKKLDESNLTLYDGIPIIKTSEVYKKKDIRVLICVFDRQISKEIENCFVEKDSIEFISYRYTITARELLTEYPSGIYSDILGNKVEFDSTIPISLQINLEGVEATVLLGKKLRVTDKLDIYMGSEGNLSVGDATTFIGVDIDCAWGRIQIGKDCMFSWDVYIRNDDGHHIFDIATGERINLCGDIKIGDHCWIGQGALLLKNIEIEDGCIIGAKSVVTKSIACNSIVAGNPAKVVKTGIRWERNWTKRDNIRHINDIYSE